MPLNRFLTRLIALCVTPLVVLAILLAILYIHHIQDETQVQAQGIAQSLMTSIDNTLNARIGGLQILAKSPLADDAARWTSLYQEAQAYRESLGGHVVFADANLRVQFNTRLPFGAPVPALPQPKGRSAVESARLSLKPAVGDPFMGSVAGEALIAIAAPGVRNNAATHLLITTIEVRELKHALQHTTLPPGWVLSLHDGTGEEIARHISPPSQTETRDGSAKRFVVKSSVSPWSIVVEIPRNIYIAPLVNAVGALVIGILLATMLAVFGGKLAARRLGKSVASLAGAPTMPAPADDIAEIDAVRHMLYDAYDKRNQAEAARHDSEQRARAAIEVAAHKLALSEARLRGIVDSATDAIITADETFTIVMANPAAATVFRCRLDEVIGAPLERFIPARYRAQHARHVRVFGESDVNARHMGGERQVMGLRADGEEFPIDAAISHLTVDNQRLYTVMLRDISERVRSRNELQRYADIVESSGDAILSRLNDGTIVTWNAAAQQLFGYTREQIIGKGVEALYSPRTPPAQRDLSARAARGERIVNFETLRMHKNGSDIAVAVTIAPLRDAQGTVIASTAILRDITERKRTEAKVNRMLLEQRQAEVTLRESRDRLRELSSALQTVREEEKTRIARELHDELGQALTALKMDTTAIANELDPTASSLRRRTDDMKRLIDATVMSVRRIAADLRPVMLDNLGLVPTLEWLTRDFSSRTGIQVDLEMVDSDLDVTGDAATAIYRIAQEALTNVARHSGADFVSIEMQRGEGQIVMRISDNGKGIAEADTRKARSFGLIGMQERAFVLGGELSISRARLGGTLVHAVIPAFGKTVSADPLGSSVQC